MAPEVQWGSDAIAQAIRHADVPYITLNPGASFRGLHDSLVNYLGDENPRMLVCLHEEHAVAIAHGYAKVTGQPLAVVLHSNVGLMHASMAIFNGFCDRVPMLLIGATGPLAADSRRPWIDWIHTASDMPALVRDFVKWDDQPTTVRASADSILRANQLTRAYPSAPTYVCVDAGVQEQPVTDWRPRDHTRYRPPSRSAPDPTTVADAARVLSAARRPVVLAGRVSRDNRAWQERIQLAERLGARVLTDLKTAAAFPTDHPLHGAAPANALAAEDRDLLAGADAVLALEWEDLGGTLAGVFGTTEPLAHIVTAGSEHELFNGWTKNDYALAPVDIMLNCHPDDAVRGLLERIPPVTKAIPADRTSGLESPSAGMTGPLTVAHLARALRSLVGHRQVTLAHAPTSWPADQWPMTEPLSYLGSDGGGGIGSGPGIAVGAALALRDSGRLTVAVLGDGDSLMGITALWTAARYHIPLLVVVANNGSYFNDELHQNRMALVRDRPRANAHVGMRTEGPHPDIAAMAQAMGLAGFGGVTTEGELDDALGAAIAQVDDGTPCVVDVTVERGYSSLAEAHVRNDRAPR